MHSIGTKIGDLGWP